MIKRVFVMMAMVLAAFGVGTPAALAEVQVFTVHLAPSGDPDGSGIANVRVDSAQDLVCYSIVVRNIGTPTEPGPGVGSAHIHGPLPSTGIAIDLDAVFMATGTSTYIARDCVSADSDTIDALLTNPELFYVNVHNVEFPGGAVQGSLG
ncbi:MAG: CHRD domain-containing protein [Actinobacteria bacterium]|nr:CHRD domain-containing protein [Actinomycetota bacterium]